MVKYDMDKKYFFIIAAFILIGFSGIYYLGKQTGNVALESSFLGNFPFVKKETVTPTPFPFRELTVPYLRNRTYQSKLGDLEKISENAVYASYLTSYDSDGLKVNGLLTVPITDAPPIGGFPAIVFVHGYIPPKTYRTTVNYASYVDYLARNGFVVFKIDLRGHADSEGEPGGAYYSSDYIIDTLHAYSALQASEFVNPQKIGLWGHSMAGNVVFKSMVVKPEIKATVIWAGAVYTYSDMQKYGINDGSYSPPPQDTERQKKRRLLRELYGEFDPGHQFWKQVAGTNYLDGVKGSLQLNHAVNDNVVSINYSRDLIKILENAGIPGELKEYSEGGHNLTGATFNAAMQNTADFFQKNL